MTIKKLTQIVNKSTCVNKQLLDLQIKYEALLRAFINSNQAQADLNKIVLTKLEKVIQKSK
jgi:hypothetical protein